MKGAIYVRVSTDKQEYDRQLNELKMYAKKEKIKIAYIFEEKESGFNSSRPEYNKLMNLTKDQIDIVLIWELSRLSRKSVEIQYDIEKLAEKGIDVYIHNKGLHTLDKDGSPNATTKLIISIIATLAEEEAKTFKERSKSAKQHNVLNEGKSYTSHAPFGYSLENKQLYIDEEEAKIVKLIFQLCIDGYSMYGIAVFLNSQGIKNRIKPIYEDKNKVGRVLRRDKGTWVTATIKTILENKVYIGKPQYRTKTKWEVNNEGQRRRTVFETVELDKPELAIISEEMFYKAAEARKMRKSRCIASDVEPYLLQHIFKCPDCQRFFTFDRSRSRQQYKCTRKFDKIENKATCRTPALCTRRVDYMLWESVKKTCLEMLSSERRESSKQAITVEITRKSNYIQDIEKQKAELLKKAQVITETAITIKLKFPNMPELFDKEIEKADELNKECGKLDNEIKKYKEQIGVLESQFNALLSLNSEEYLEEIDFEHKYDLIHRIIDVAYPFSAHEDENVIIEVRLKTGGSFYLGYYPWRAYYLQFEPTDENYFDFQKGVGKMLYDGEEVQKPVWIDIPLDKYLEINDLPENRHIGEPVRKDQKRKAQL